MVHFQWDSYKNTFWLWTQTLFHLSYFLLSLFLSLSISPSPSPSLLLSIIIDFHGIWIPTSVGGVSGHTSFCQMHFVCACSVSSFIRSFLWFFCWFLFDFFSFIFFFTLFQFYARISVIAAICCCCCCRCCCRRCQYPYVVVHAWRSIFADRTGQLTLDSNNPVLGSFWSYQSHKKMPINWFHMRNTPFLLLRHSFFLTTLLCYAPTT